MMKFSGFGFLAGVVLCSALTVQAAFVTIGNAGNTADTTGYGAVGYTYRLSATEVTIAEFQASGAGDGDENYWSTVGTNAPAVNVSLYEAMKYCNYLTTGDVNNGLYEDKGSGVWGAIFDRATVMAGSTLYYALPTENEWYKAAYFKPDVSGYSIYANGTGTAPAAGTVANYNNVVGSTWAVGTGAEEQNGSFDMMGNVFEWMENSEIRSGSYNLNETYLRSSYRLIGSSTAEVFDLGFRVVAVPEPATALLLAIGGGIFGLIRRFYGRR